MNQIRHVQRGETMRPLVGEDGRLYFNYCRGAEYLCEETKYIGIGDKTEPQFKQFVLKVENCEYVDGIEYYYMSRDGRAISSPFSANRLHYLLNFSQVDELAPGIRQELPLTAGEIRTYFEKVKIFFETQQAKAYKILEDIPRYFELKKERAKLSIRIGCAEACGEDSAALENKLGFVEAEMDGLCYDAGIDPRYLRDRKCCPECGGSGMIAANRPCGCALRLEKAIKTYCAGLRLNGRQGV